MAETVREVSYYYMMASNKPGEGAALSSMLKEAGVSLLAVHAFPERRRVQVDIVPEDARAFTAFRAQGEDQAQPPEEGLPRRGNGPHGRARAGVHQAWRRRHQHHRHHGHRRGQEALRRHLLGEPQGPAPGQASAGGVNPTGKGLLKNPLLIRNSPLPSFRRHCRFCCRGRIHAALPVRGCGSHIYRTYKSDLHSYGEAISRRRHAGNCGIFSTTSGREGLQNPETTTGENTPVLPHEPVLPSQERTNVSARLS